MWEAYLFQTITGRIGPKVDLASATWSVDLNDTETLSVQVKKQSLPDKLPMEWLDPWWGGIVLFWGDTPIVAGISISNPTETFESLEFSCSGIRALLDRRVVTDENKLGTLNSSFIQYKGVSLGTVAQRVLKVAMEKEGGNLPIRFPQPEQTVRDDADHQRTYRGYNVANLRVDDVLDKLSNSINGPDVMFRPRSTDKSILWYDMIHGTENNPRIAQTNTPVWDITATKGSVADFSTTRTGTYQTDRVYSIGTGEDEGTLIQIAQNLSRVQKQYPLLETVIKQGDSENPATVMGWAKGSLEANRDPIHEINITVRADGLYPLGSFWPGDEIEIIVEGWLTIKNGRRKARLIGMSGDLTNNVKLVVQIER